MKKQSSYDKQIAELERQLAIINKEPCRCPISRTGVCCRCQDWFDTLDSIAKIKQEMRKKHIPFGA